MIYIFIFIINLHLKETGEILMPQDMKKSQSYGGQSIYLENEEVTQIKKFDDPGTYSYRF